MATFSTAHSIKTKQALTGTKLRYMRFASCPTKLYLLRNWSPCKNKTQKTKKTKKHAMLTEDICIMRISIAKA